MKYPSTLLAQASIPQEIQKADLDLLKKINEVDALTEANAAQIAADYTTLDNKIDTNYNDLQNQINNKVKIEYASNDGSGGTAAGTIYNTGMVAGESNFVAVNSTTNTGYSSTLYKVTFQRPILDGDVLSIKISNSNLWVPVESTFPYMIQTSAIYGIGITLINTDAYSIYVQVGNAGIDNRGGYNALGVPWSAVTSYKWRVEKITYN